MVLEEDAEDIMEGTSNSNDFVNVTCKVKRSSLIGPYNKAGLRASQIQSYIRCLKCILLESTLWR